MSGPDPILLAAVRRQVQEFVPATPREVESRWRLLVELDELPEPFRRDAGPVHVTGSGIISGRRGTVLLVHKTLGIWVQPGGHLDPDETPADAALRETIEETGLGVRHPGEGPTLIHLDVHPAADEHVHLDLRYLLVCDDDAEPSPPKGESQEVRWWSLGEAIKVADDGLVDGLGRLSRL